MLCYLYLFRHHSFFQRYFVERFRWSQSSERMNPSTNNKISMFCLQKNTFYFSRNFKGSFLKNCGAEFLQLLMNERTRHELDNIQNWKKSVWKFSKYLVPNIFRFLFQARIRTKANNSSSKFSTFSSSSLSQTQCSKISRYWRNHWDAEFSY